jgi:N-acetyltransferase
MDLSQASKRRRDWDDEESAQQSSILSFFGKCVKARVVPSRKKLNEKGHGTTHPTSSTSVATVFSNRVTQIIQEEHTLLNSSNDNDKGKGKKNTKKNPKQQQQLYLDFGQRNFGKQIVCQTCGMLYVHGVAEDIQRHDLVCKDYREGVSFQLQAKSCRIIQGLGGMKTSGAKSSSFKDDIADGLIVEVRPSDSHNLRQKVKQAMAIVDKELGFFSASHSAASTTIDDVGAATTSEEEEGKPKTVYLFIRQKRIVGVLSAEIIREAFPLLQSTSGSEENPDDQQEPKLYPRLHLQQLERSRVPTRAILGVHKIWVHATMRKRRTASRLLDAARARMVFGSIVPVSLVAFSSPTESGARFAYQYMHHKVSARTSSNNNEQVSPVLVYDS